MAIRDLSYTRYEGPIRERYAWAVIGWSGFVTYWRFWRTKLTYLAVWLVPLLFSLGLIAEYALQNSQLAQLSEGGTIGVSSIRLYLQVQVFSLALVFAANGCGIISDDLRHRTVQLYFSKPITKADYAFGKYLTLLLQGAATVLIPSIFLAGLRTAFYARSEVLPEIIVMHLKGLFLATILIVVMSAMVIGLSSLTRRTGYAVLAWIALLFVPLILQVITSVVSEGSPLASLWSLLGLISLASQGLLQGTQALPDVVPIWAPFLVLAALFSAGIAALYWRISRLQGIA